MSEAIYIKKTDIVATIRAARPNLSGRQVWRAVDMIIDQMIVALAHDTSSAHDGDIFIGGLGVFHARATIRAARTINDVNHPGQTIDIPAVVGYSHWFTPCAALAAAVKDIPEGPP